MVIKLFSKLGSTEKDSTDIRFKAFITMNEHMKRAGFQEPIRKGW